MGYKEALEDGIKIEHLKRNVYYIPCEICGREIKRTSYSRSFNYLCDYCKGVVRKKQKIEINNNLKTKAEIRFEKAIDELKKQVYYYESYDKYIEKKRTKTEKYGSIPEVMVAIELLRLGYRIIPQQKVGKYSVDFAIPKEKIVLEIDGCIYHSAKNNVREAEIQIMLGMDWKIIHIPAEFIRKDIKKLKNIIDKI